MQTNHKPITLIDLAKSKRDVEEHDQVTDDDGVDVRVTFTFNLVFDGPLCPERHLKRWSKPHNAIVCIITSHTPPGAAAAAIGCNAAYLDEFVTSTSRQK